MTFQLDTTGHVVNGGDGTNSARQPILFWSDLSPFTQGYIEALFSAEEESMNGENSPGGYIEGRGYGVRFDDLDPQALARIITDCEAAIRDGYDNTISAGSTFYAEREEGCEPAFLPMTVYLGDDGKVRFAAQPAGEV